MDLQPGFRIGVWNVYPLEGEIRDGDSAIHLEPKVMEVLVALADRAPAVLRRDELADRVWGRRAAVSDEPLTRCIAQLRQALGDSSREPEYVQTVPKRGYRLLKSVVPIAADDDRGDSPDARPAVPDPVVMPRELRRQPAVGLLIAAFVIVTALWFMRPLFVQTADAGHSIAILSGIDRGGRAVDDDTAGSLSMLISRSLTGISALRIAPRDRIYRLIDSGLDVTSAGRRLQVDYVLLLETRSEGGMTRLNVWLNDVARDAEIWSYTDLMGDSMAELSKQQTKVCSELIGRIALTGNTPGRCDSLPPTGNFEALSLVALAERRIEDRDLQSLSRAMDALRRAIGLDPAYGEAYLNLAHVYTLMPKYGDLNEPELWYSEAAATLDDGERHDTDVAKLRHFVDAAISYERRDWERADGKFRLALTATPDDPELLQLYTRFLASTGRMQEAASVARMALEADAKSPVANQRYAIVLMWLGDYSQARKYYEQAIELGLSEQANRETGAVLNMQLRHYDEAGRLLKELQRAGLPTYPWVDEFIGYFDQRVARDDAVRAVAAAAEHGTIPRVLELGAWFYLEEWDRAMDVAFDLAASQQFDVEYLFSKDAAPLRQRPRFAELLTTVGLVDYWARHEWDNDFCSMRGTQLECG